MAEFYDLQHIDKWFEDHREDMIRDIRRIVRIPSVSEAGSEGGPFGSGCKAALEEMLQLGREHGFCTENYEDYVGCIGPEHKDLKNTIGFWNHLDIVPIGGNWQYDPFESAYQEPFLIGRGVEDNKGPAIGILYVMKCMKELNIPLKHHLCLFLGCDEEKGMTDLEYYTGHYETPALSIIPDTDFPVCYGEKGILEGEMIAKESLSQHFIGFKGGIASNMIPDEVSAVLTGDAAFLDKLEEELSSLKEEYANHHSHPSASDDSASRDAATYFEYHRSITTIAVTYHGISRHSAFPYGSSNAIHGLCQVLSRTSVLPQSDLQILSVIHKLSAEYLGEVPGIAFRDDISGHTTCAATMIDLREGKLCLTLNIRYAITADNEKDLASLSSFAEANHLLWNMQGNSKPGYFPKEHPTVQLLTDVFNEFTGEKRESYVMGGGTYARKLPNAIAYGLGGIKESEEDQKLRSLYIRSGHGGAHEPDEVLNMNSFIQGLKIFARAVIALNDVTF